MRSSVQLSAAARLHFGLAGLGCRGGPSFGGLGLMINQPRAVVQLRPALRWRKPAPDEFRCMSVCRQALQVWDRAGEIPAVEFSYSERIPLHRGLGAGTQHCLALAAGVRRLLDLPPAAVEDLAFVAGRGARSAVGAHGFMRGGLIWETGRMPGDRLGRFGKRVALPAGWRVVLAIPRREQGLNGPAESAAFARLPAPDAAVTERLVQLAEDQILPAAQRQAFDDFSAAVFDYSRTSGTLFAPVQGGEYASPKVAARVKAIRAAGAAAVGQSSWGPTVFALQPSEAAASELIRRLDRNRAFAECEWLITSVENHSARVKAGARLPEFVG